LGNSHEKVHRFFTECVSVKIEDVGYNCIMTLRKIDEEIYDRWKFAGQHMCRHPEHNPPTMIVLEPGLYEHTCPACGKKIIFREHEKPTL